MTPEEFKTWDWHKAENLQSQRDDALARIAAADASAAMAAKVNADAIKAATDPLNAQIAAFPAQLAEKNAIIATLRQQLADAQTHIEALGGTELAQKLAREQRIEVLRQHHQRINDELANLNEQHVAAQ